jgi:hypothetical protein
MPPRQPGSVPDSSERRWWLTRVASWPGLLVAVLLAVWLTTGLWGREPPSGDDTMAHLVRAQFTLDELVPHAQLDGWQSRFGLGYQQFLFYGPGFTWAVVLLHWLSLGLLSVAGAFKVVAVASFVALPLSVAYLAVSLGLGRRAAGLAAILVLCVSSPFGGIGLEGTFGIGLIPNQLGAVFTCLALGAMLRLVTDPGPRRVVIAGVALAAVFVTHAISAVILAVLLAVILLTFLGTEELQARTVRCLVGAFILACGLAAFWLVPAFAHNNLRGALTGWENPPLAERLADILAGRLLFHGLLVWLLLAGWLYAVHRFQQRQPWALALVMTPFAYLWLRICSCVGIRTTSSACSSPTADSAMLAFSPSCRSPPSWPMPRPGWGSSPAGAWRGRRPPSSRQRCWWWQSVAPAEARWSTSRPRPRCCVLLRGSSRRAFPTVPVSSPSVTSPMSAGSPVCRIRISGCRGRRGGTS